MQFLKTFNSFQKLYCSVKIVSWLTGFRSVYKFLSKFSRISPDISHTYTYTRVISEHILKNILSRLCKKNLIRSSAFGLIKSTPCVYVSYFNFLCLRWQKVRENCLRIIGKQSKTIKKSWIPFSSSRCRVLKWFSDTILLAITA